MTPSALDAFAIAKASLPEVSVRRGSAPAPSSREQTEALFLVAARISCYVPRYLELFNPSHSRLR